MSALLPLPVAIPLATAAFLLLVGRLLPWHLPLWLAVMSALGVLGIDLALTSGTAEAPLVYWFGNWAPRGGLPIGVGFVVTQADAAIAALVALLFAASFVFAFGYFEDIQVFFHVLMLLFLAAMQGFCLTHDLFNLFVWFEVMSVVAFALTAYRLEASAIEGALNFTVTNSLASFMMLGGIGLLYLRFGALDYGALGARIAAAPDALVAGAFCLLAAALLIKGAVVPFHFWLAEAHAVAPSPVSVIFSGAMVPLGLFGIAKLYFEVFAAAAAVGTLLNSVLLCLGAASTLIAGFACLRQRHLKRLLAFSTISHIGIMLSAIALRGPKGLAGCFAYLVGHGLVKGALFMIAGILLAKLSDIDEIRLRGCGGAIWPAGVAMAIGGLLLGGVPVGLLDDGARIIDAAATEAGREWLAAPLILGTACTGAAVLRACGRIFLGLGEGEGEEGAGPSEPESESGERPLWLMLAPVLLLLALAVWLGLLKAEGFSLHAAARFVAWDPAASLGRLQAAVPLSPEPPPHPFLPWLTTGLALVIAAHELNRARLPRWWVRSSDLLVDPPLKLIDQLHRGVIGDYVAWIMVGLALFSAGFLAIG